MRRVSLTTLTACLLLLSASAAPQQKPALSVTDVFHIQYADDPQISPDGKRIVYVRRASDATSDRTYSNLWVISADGSDHRPLTTGIQNDNSPRWSPDGKRLAYVSDAGGGRPQIHVRWMDTGQTARVTNLPYAPAGLNWSPDGKQISFASFVPAEPLNLIKMPKAPEGAKWEEAPKAYDKLVYRFNGPGFLKPGFTQIFVVPAEGGAPRQITQGEFQHGGTGFRASDAVWTADGKHLLVAANRKPDYELNAVDTEIYEFSVADGSVRALTDRRGPDHSPAISPDGKRIAYVGFDDKLQGYQVSQLHLMNRDGSGGKVALEKLDRDVRSPQWARDGSGIYFLYDDQGDTRLAFYSLDGQLKTLASSIGSGGSAYTTGNSFSLAGDGSFAVTYTTPEIPGDIAVGGRMAKPRVVTNINHSLLEQRGLGQVEEVWYPSSVDQRKVHAWVIKPPNFDPAKKYPLILEIHGGPFANYGPRFDLEKQVWAANGYVVLYVNPRGSTSYGGEFGNLIHHAYPGDDYYDLNAGVDAVIAKGYVDPAQLFVTGGSGGGVLTCWMIGRTDRFRAAATLYPVINWYSFVLTADIPWTSRYWFPGFPWDHTEHYMQRSVISTVKNVKTPTLVMTGEADYRTPMAESEQYYQALKMLNVETVLVRVPDEPHGIRRHPSHHIAKMLYVQGWFDRYRSKEKPAAKAAGE